MRLKMKSGGWKKGRHDRSDQSAAHQNKGRFVSANRDRFSGSVDSRAANDSGRCFASDFDLVLLPVLLFRLLRDSTLRRSELPVLRPVRVLPLYDATETPIP